MATSAGGSEVPVGLSEVGAVVMRFINVTMQHVHRNPEEKKIKFLKIKAERATRVTRSLK